MDRYALTFKINPGSEEQVAGILSAYGRVSTEVDGDARLLRTTVLMKDQDIVRVIDVEGDLVKVIQHLASQPEIRKVEEQLNAHLSEPRDMTPEGARAFFQRAIMKRLTHRVLPIPGAESAKRYALVYPFKPGTGGHADAVFETAGDPPPQAGAGTRLRSTTVFRKEDLLVRLFEIDGDLDEAIEHLVHASQLFDAGARLQPYLEGDADLTNEAGLRRFFSEQMMRVVTDRIAGQ